MEPVTKTYDVELICRNCRKTQIVKVKYGAYRPEKCDCDYCGCKKIEFDIV